MNEYWQEAPAPVPAPPPETWRVHARLQNGRVGAWLVPKNEATWDEALHLVMQEPNVRSAMVVVQ